MKRLLCTDLDRTLLPNGTAPEAPAARLALAELVEAAPLSLAYVSGRSLALVQAAIDEYALPVPDVIAADVGSSVHHRSGDDWQVDHAWSERIARNWGWGPRLDIDAALAGIDGLTLQEERHQTPFKRSFAISRGSDDRSALERLVVAALERAEIHASLLISHDPHADVDLLDVLPPYGSKLHAVRHLRDALGVAPDAIVYSGDSGNDLDVLVSEVPAVLVANGDDSTRRAALERLRGTALERTLYLARGGVALGGIGALDGNYAAGIVEGVLHFHPELGRHLTPEALEARLAADAAQRPR